jgi:hypothetical protein
MNDRLQSAMNRWATEGNNVEPPADMEAALVAEFYRVRRRRKRASWTLLAGTLAASVLAVLATQHGLPLTPHPRSAPVVEDVQESEQPFVGLPYITPPAPYERIHVERMKLSVAALIAVGLPMQGADPGAQVEADVVVGQDGRARAVRLIAASTRSN